MHIIGGKFKRRTLLAPKSDAVRPTTSQLREALFNICQSSIEEATFLDLFAGSGAVGLEAISRGAQHATFVESSRLALPIIRKNIASLQIESVTTLYGMDVFQALKKLHAQGHKFSHIFADPPYGKGLGAAIVHFLDEHPLLQEGGMLFIEDSELKIPPLKHLHLMRQRQIGSTLLSEFEQ